jgi:hypothetical protein
VRYAEQFRRRIAVGIAVTLVVGAGSISGSPAAAAGPRPLFQLPFACGESWHLATYQGHDDYDIDMTANTGVTNGRPILASYGGTVTTAGWSNGGGWYVKINHGDGWQTLYLHMIERPVVVAGQHVEIGQQLGRVGSTGNSSGPHLHYEQLRDGDKVESWFNGVPSGITSDGDPTTGPLYIGGPPSPPVDVISNNGCPGSAPPLTSNGRLGDFDGNGRPDIAAYTGDRDSLYFSRNTSTPGNPSKGFGEYYSTGWKTVDHKMTVDWDGDGKDDIIGRNGDDLYVWRSTSTNTNWSLMPYTNLGSGNATVSQYLFGDFDGNGRPDIAAYSPDRDSLFFSRNTSTPGNPSKGFGEYYSTGWKTVDHKMVADWDGDGKDDIIGRNGDDLYVWRSTSTSTGWSLMPFVNLGSGNSTVSQYLLADFDDNGRPDIAAYTADRNSLYFSRNTSTPGNPSKAGGQYYSTGWQTVDHKMVADWDGDGKDDIIGRNGDDLYVWRSTSTSTGWSLSPFVNLGSGNSTVSQYLTDAPVA